jgi:chemotaxis protein methyltransferase CheR
MALNDLLPEAYFLKGVLLDAEDQLTAAAAEYRKALLLDHDFIMPRYHMGRLHLRQGRTAEAAREIRNSIKILSRCGSEETIPFSGGLTRAVCMLQLQNALAQVA